MEWDWIAWLVGGQFGIVVILSYIIHVLRDLRDRE